MCAFNGVSQRLNRVTPYDQWSAARPQSHPTRAMSLIVRGYSYQEAHHHGSNQSVSPS